MDNTRGPARLVPPGRIIERELDARGWTQKDLAEIMARPEQAISEIVNGKKRITPETARELASAFGTSTDFWINIETRYRLRLAEREGAEEDIRRRGALYSAAPYGELVKRGWIERCDTLDAQEQALCRYLRVPSLAAAPQLAASFRRVAERGPEQWAEIAWARRIEFLASQQSVAPFDSAALISALPEILACTREPSDAAQLPTLLARLGVHFVIAPHLPRTYLDGAALHVGDRPIIGLTLRHDRLDHFWFTVLHELAHIVLGHRGAWLDRLCDGESPAGGAEEERAANAQARDWLIAPDAYRAFTQEGAFTAQRITAWAAQLARHPSIALGQLQTDGLVSSHRFANLHARVRPHLLAWIDTPGPTAGLRHPIGAAAP